MDDLSTSTKVVAGLGLVGVALGLFAVFGLEDDEHTDTGCALTAAGVTQIAKGLNNRQSADAIIQAGGMALGTVLCKEVVNSLVDDPTTPVSVTVQLSPNDGRQGTVTAIDFMPPSSQPPSSQSAPSTCYDWVDPNWEAACLSGRVSPPPPL